MGVLIIGGVLSGMILGRFLKVLVLVPVCSVFVALLLSRPIPEGYSLVYPVLEIAVLVFSLQLGYAAGLLSRNMRGFWQRARSVWTPNFQSGWRSYHVKW